MLFNFILNQRTFLALARAEVGPILQALAETPALPETCQWATFLRNHDEVDLGRLVGHEHDEVFAAFGPDPDMQLYGRGIRRRLAPDARQRPAAASRWPTRCSSACPGRR